MEKTNQLKSEPISEKKPGKKPGLCDQRAFFSIALKSVSFGFFLQ